MPYQKTRLEKAAADYVVEVLQAGNTFSRILAASRDLRNEVWFAFLPVSLNPSEIKNYRWAYGSRREDSIAHITPTIRQFLENHERAICLLENRYCRKRDPAARQCRSRSLFFQQEMYHILEKEQSTDEAIRTAITDADTGMSLVGACTQARPSQWSANKELTLSDLEELAFRTEILFVGAFDGGGFLIWNEREEARTAVAPLIDAT
jgi:hypothetical protein